MIEVLVSVGIFTLIGLAMYSFQSRIFSLNTMISSDLAAQTEVRRAFKTMSSEIRTASPSSLGSYPLSETATSSFIFYSNIDADSYKEQVRYFLQGTTLKKGVIKPSGAPLVYNPMYEVVTELIHHVVNATTSVFTYYDTNYDGTTQPLTEPIDISTVRLVKVTVFVDENTEDQLRSHTFTTQISMRNLKDNL